MRYSILNNFIMPRRLVKKAKKTFKFWFKVLLETELMDDSEHRKEYLRALRVFKKKPKKVAT